MAGVCFSLFSIVFVRSRRPFVSYKRRIDMAEAYLSRGVSPTKDDVHKAISRHSKGEFPGAFCKVVADPMGDPEWCSMMHADGAGTKSILAYLSYKETGDATVFRGIAQDSLVMNIDDLLCVGAAGPFLVSNTIGRNAHRIPGNLIAEVITGYDEMAQRLTDLGVPVVMTGGETADVGDLVATMIVDSTVFTRLRRADVIDAGNIRAGDVIIGLSSVGKAVYESFENSGIGSNGLTAARHLLLSDHYRDTYPEGFSPTIPADKVYNGPWRMNDPLPNSSMTVGQALLSPTRTYAPVLAAVLTSYRSDVHGIIHCTGGGQVKCRGFGNNVHYIKDNLFPVPPVFAAIQSVSDTPLKEMYQIFNMGHRMELMCKAGAAEGIIAKAAELGIEARIVGRVESSSGENRVTITSGGEVLEY